MEKLDEKFATAFHDLTGNPPFPWQKRLFHALVKNDLPSQLDIPTGLGKTSVMSIWFLARATGANLPRRLIYVVDRRTVVDQATKDAEKILNYDKTVTHHGLSISTLRGQHADNREWTHDPSRPAIIVGTVDMIGSRLLFSGYRSSYKQRPLDAGMLGQDSLLILDEAHLSKPFNKLISDISNETDAKFQRNRDGSLCGAPMQVIRMSATNDTTESKLAFQLEGDFEKRTGDFLDEIVRERYSASKWLSIEPPIEKKDLNNAIAKAGVDLAKDGARVVVFVRSPDNATKIADAIRKKSNENDGSNQVEVLTGTMRGLERDDFLHRPIVQRFLTAGNTPDAGSAILVSTSAGELGFDLNADHMVCDAAPLDSMIQRLGRVNRRGKGNATVRLFTEKMKADKKNKDNGADEANPARTMDTASVAALEILRQLSAKKIKGAVVYDASPKALAALPKPDKALSPVPVMIDLTDILMDAWSMTSITERMPGRPEVAPWLRGIEDTLPDTTIAWRAELDEDGFDQLDLEDIEEWFDTHRILTHETLSVPTNAAADWFLNRWNLLGDEEQRRVGALPVVIDRVGLEIKTIREIVAELYRKNTASIRNADLTLPASFGGIERNVGLLDEKSPTLRSDNNQKPTEKQENSKKEMVIAADVAAVPHVNSEKMRFRVIETSNDEGEIHAMPLANDALPDDEAKKKCARFVVELSSKDDTVRRLVSYVPKWDRLDMGTEKQTLNQHVELVCSHVLLILDRLKLPEDARIRKAVELAAQWHDHGKNRERWQRLVGGQVTNSGEAEPGKLWAKNTLGKSGGKMLKDSRGYRHEFGSLREFIDSHETQLDAETFDLTMHLIATHHGRGRPHFPKGGFDPDAEVRSAEIHTDVMRRFSRLQHTYGHWHLSWLENLLRCADAMASAKKEGVPHEDA